MKTIYLTGTVNDMQAEYEAVKSYVMPQVNEFLAQYGEEAELMGFMDTSTDDGCRKELKACFRELKKGDVYFISLLSERYGDIPPSDVTDGFLEKVGIEADENVTGKSVMEIETFYAALNDPNKAVIYFREPITKKEAAGSQKIFLPAFGEGRKVKKLKNAIKRISDLTIHEYKLDMADGVPSEESVNAFASRIAEDLKLVIAADLSRNTDNNEGAQETPAEEAKAHIAAPINITKAKTPIWDKLKEESGEKYNPEELRKEAFEINKNAVTLEQNDPDAAGDLYDEAMDIFRQIRKDAEAGGMAFDDTLDESRRTRVTDEVIRDMGLVYFSYARIEFNAKNFEGAAAWGKQAIDSMTEYQRKYNTVAVLNDLSNIWMLMAASLANSGEPVAAIDGVAAAISCCDGISHSQGFKPTEEYANRYRSNAQLANSICINEKTGEAAKKWLKFCQQQSYRLSKMGDRAGMINYVNFSMALLEHQIYQQQNYENVQQYISMLHEMAQMFQQDRNEEMLKLLSDKAKKLMGLLPDDEKINDLGCSIITLYSNVLFSALKHEEALENYTEVIEKRDGYKNSTDQGKRIVIAADYARRASAYTELNRLDEAAQGYQEAISVLKTIRDGSKNERVVGELASAYMNYSVCLGKQGNIEEATKTIGKASKLLKGFKLTQPNLINLRRRIRRMRQLAESNTPDAMYKPEFMEKARAEMDKLRQANEFVHDNDFAKAAELIEEALNNIKAMNMVDIVLPSESYAANLATCGSIYQDKLKNEVKGTGLLRNAWAVLIEMENDGLRLNPQLVNNIKTRLKIK